jgi:hypothetical protein
MAEFRSGKAVSVKKGGRYYYSLGEKSLSIDPAKGTIKEYIPSAGTLIRFNGHALYEGSLLPVDLDVFSKNDKLSVKIKFSSVTLNQPAESGIFDLPANAGQDK